MPTDPVFQVVEWKVLIVEDSPTQAHRLEFLLSQKGFLTTIAGSAEEALASLEKQLPDLIISDVVMPGMNGYDLCANVKKDPRLSAIPVVLLTSLADPSDIIKGLECGADNFITKPYDEEYLFSCLQRVIMNRSLTRHEALHVGLDVFFAGKRHRINAEKQQILGLLLSTFETAVQKNQELLQAQVELRELNEQLEFKVRQRTESLTAEIAQRIELEAHLQKSNRDLFAAYETTIEGWSRALDLRDQETEGHTRRVAAMTLCLARSMGMPEEELIHVRRGALLHDIGKMAIPDCILLKPGPLTEEEWVIMKKHPQYAYDFLFPVMYLRPAIDIPYCHHEKWDGTGYPQGLKGEQIPKSARIFAVADIWDALQSDRPYRRGWSTDKIREHIRALSGTHLEPQIVDAFLAMDAENTAGVSTGMIQLPLNHSSG